ncbi:MAG: hypothetical protein ACXVA9_06570 [Bdellovibrionales bacterium]
MLRILLFAAGLTLFTQGAFARPVLDMSTYGSDHYACPGSGHSDSNGAFKNDAQCAPECENLVFDCSQHKLMAAGKQVEIDGERWLGCDKQTGQGNGSKPHKIKQDKDSCGRGDPGHLPQDEPKLMSDPLPCDNCVIHRMTKGIDTAGCLGLEAKLFDFVYKTCGGCSYTIVPPTGGSGVKGSGGDSGSGQARPGEAGY